MTYRNSRMEPRVSIRTVSLRMAEFYGRGQFLFKSIFVCRRQVRQKREVCLRQIARWHIGQWRRQCRVLHSLKIRLRRNFTSSKKFHQSRLYVCSILYAGYNRNLRITPGCTSRYYRSFLKKRSISTNLDDTFSLTMTIRELLGYMRQHFSSYIRLPAN